MSTYASGHFYFKIMEIIKGKLYKSKISELVVIANEDINENRFSGTAIKKTEAFEVGEYGNSFDKKYFQPYSAEIIIKEVIDFSKVQFVEMESGEIVFVTGICFNEDSFAGYNIKGADFKAFWLKSEAKRVVTAKFE